jgi:putative Holliday junction resolvase
MRILGIDYGKTRTGIAISDALGISAQPLPTIQNLSGKSLIDKIVEIVSEKEVEEIVVGLPRNMDGSLGASGTKVMKFVEELRQALSCPVEVEDERLTTMMADKALAAMGEKPRARKKKLDRVAAQIILQSYLDKQQTCQGDIEE